MARWHLDDVAVALKRARSTANLLRWILVMGVVIGFAAGRGWHESPVTAADSLPAATATRAAELTEVADLRTRVAQTVVCTPAPTETATPTPSPQPTATLVPPIASGSAVTYGDTWQITPLSVQPVVAPSGFEVEGQLVLVSLSFANTSNDSARPPFADLRLVDDVGNASPVSVDATTKLGFPELGLAIGPHDAKDLKLAFDVELGAGNSFVLESTKDPTFRVQLTVEARG